MVDDAPPPREERRRARRRSAKSTSTWFQAAERDEQFRMEQLLEAGQEINELDPITQSPALYIASRTNNLEMAEWLIKNGANPAVSTDDLATPAWIAISRGFSEMLEVLLNPEFRADFVAKTKDETAQDVHAGLTHMAIAKMRRYWRCVYLLEQAYGIEESVIPESFFEVPEGWAMELVPIESGQSLNHKMKWFYWKAFTKEKCIYDPPEGSTKMTHAGGGRFEASHTVDAKGGLVPAAEVKAAKDKAKAAEPKMKVTQAVGL